jgi:hypothetical protein
VLEERDRGMVTLKIFKRVRGKPGNELFAISRWVKVKLSRYSMQAPRVRGYIDPTHS